MMHTGMPGMGSTPCGTGKDIIKTAEAVQCASTGCTETLCCQATGAVCQADAECTVDEKCVNKKCEKAKCPDTYTCPAGMFDQKWKLCKIPGQCTDDDCCTPKTCDVSQWEKAAKGKINICDAGKALKFTPSNYTCPKSGCTDAACCIAYNRQCSTDNDCTQDETCSQTTGKCELTNACPSTYKCPVGMHDATYWGKCSAPGQCTDQECCMAKTCGDYLYDLGSKASTQCGANKAFYSVMKMWKLNCPTTGCDDATCCTSKGATCQVDDDCTGSEYCNSLAGKCEEKTCAVAFRPNGGKTCPKGTVLMNNAANKKCMEDPRRPCWEVDCCVADPAGPTQGPLCSLYPEATFCKTNEKCYWPSFCQMGTCYDPSVTNIKAHIKMMYPNAVFSNRRLSATQSENIAKALYKDLASSTGLTESDLKKSVNLNVPSKGAKNKSTGKMEFHATMTEGSSSETSLDEKLNQWLEELPIKSFEVDGETIRISDVKQGKYALEISTYEETDKGDEDDKKSDDSDSEPVSGAVSVSAFLVSSLIILAGF